MKSNICAAAFSSRKGWCGLLVFSACFSSVVASAQNVGQMRFDTVVAPSLEGNRVGDSNHRAVSIYLPPSYDTTPRTRYPVIYLLHGVDADNLAFIKGAYEKLDIRLAMDSLIAAGLVREMIIVTPNARNVYDGSFYVNSSATGNWEDFIVKDLVSYVDSHYRTVANRNARGIAGHSMGGYGALRLGMMHPETFSALYAISPCCLTPGDPFGAPFKNSWPKAVGLKSLSEIPSAGFAANMYYALAAVYSPNPSKPPFYVDLPFRIDRGSLEPVDSVLALWHATPLTLASRYAGNLRRMAIAFDGGTEDGFTDIPVNVMRLDSLLTSLGIAHTAELHGGTHMAGIRERIETKVLPFFSKALH